MKRFMQHKWVIPVAAMVLVLALGAVAFAATGTTDTSGAATAGPEVTSPGDGQGAQAAALRGRAGGVLRGLVDKLKGEFTGLTPGSPEFREKAKELRDKAKELMQQRRDKKQERRDSMLKLVREKMTSEEQGQFDTLLEQAKTQRDALQKARGDLGATSKQMRDLMDKYLAPGEAGAMGNGPGSGGPAEGTTTL